MGPGSTAADAEPGIGPRATVDPEEASKFARLAERWWDPEGEFAALHALGPVRIAFVRDAIVSRWRRDPRGARPLSGIRILDVGCGGGLMAEPMARLGAEVTAIDAVSESVAVARQHADRQGLRIDYRTGSVEAMAEADRRFEAVLAMEVVEHVADRRAFMATCAELVAPGGVLFLATLNRTAKAFLFAILGAEHILRWLPRGTHDWRKFVRPSEIAADLRANGLDVMQITGVGYDLVTGRWRPTKDLDVNYMLAAERPLTVR